MLYTAEGTDHERGASVLLRLSKEQQAVAVIVDAPKIPVLPSNRDDVVHRWDNSAATYPKCSAGL